MQFDLQLVLQWPIKENQPVVSNPSTNFDKKLQGWYSKEKSMMCLVEEAAWREGVWKKSDWEELFIFSKEGKGEVEFEEQL